MNSIVKEKRYISERLGIPNENLSQSYLRAETLLETTSKIDFTLQRNKATSTYVTERLLDLNDEFVITHFFVGLKADGVSSGDATDEQHLKSVVDTYECPLLYPEPQTKVGVVYNSNLNFTIDRTEFVPQFPVKAFRRVPLQQIAEYDAFGTPTVVGKNGFTNGLYGFANSEPTLINGRQTLDLSIDLGTALNFAAQTNYNGEVMKLLKAAGASSK